MSCSKYGKNGLVKKNQQRKVREGTERGKKRLAMVPILYNLAIN